MSAPGTTMKHDEVASRLLPMVELTLSGHAEKTARDPMRRSVLARRRPSEADAPRLMQVQVLQAADKSRLGAATCSGTIVIARCRASTQSVQSLNSPSSDRRLHCKRCSSA